MCSRQQGWLLILLMWICHDLTSPHLSRPIIYSGLSQLPRHAPQTGLDSPLIQPRQEKRHSSTPRTMAADTRRLLGDNRGFSSFFFSLPLVRPHHIVHLSPPSLSTWLNIVTALMNYVSPSESHSLALVSFTPPASQMCASQLRGHLKASGFNKTVIKGNTLLLVTLCLLWYEVEDLPCCRMTQTNTGAQIGDSRLQFSWELFSSLVTRLKNTILEA